MLYALCRLYATCILYAMGQAEVARGRVPRALAHSVAQNLDPGPGPRHRSRRDVVWSTAAILISAVAAVVPDAAATMPIQRGTTWPSVFSNRKCTQLRNHARLKHPAQSTHCRLHSHSVHCLHTLHPLRAPLCFFAHLMHITYKTHAHNTLHNTQRTLSPVL